MSVIKSTKLALAVVLSLVLVMGLSLTAFAQQRRSPEERAARALAQFDSMCVFVGMNAKQKTEAKKLYDAQLAATAKLREQMQSGGDRTAMREQMTKITDDFNTKLNALLNAEQKAKLVKWNEMHPRRGGGGRRG